VTAKASGNGNAAQGTAIGGRGGAGVADDARRAAPRRRVRSARSRSPSRWAPGGEESALSCRRHRRPGATETVVVALAKYLILAVDRTVSAVIDRQPRVRRTSSRRRPVRPSDAGKASAAGCG